MTLKTRDEADPFRRTCRSELEPVLGEQSVDEILRHLSDAQEALQGRAPQFQQQQNRDNFALAIPGAALYRRLQETARQTPERAKELVARVIARQVRDGFEGTWLKRVLFGAIGRSSLLCRMVEKRMLSTDEVGGWSAHAVPSDAVISLDFTACGLLGFLEQEGMAELCTVFCDADRIAARYLRGLRFERTGTLAEGAPVCDFRYYRR